MKSVRNKTEIGVVDKIPVQQTAKARKNVAMYLTILGIILIVSGELFIVFKIKVIMPYVFLLFWYGYIFLVDGINHTLRKHSLIINRPIHFLITLILSAIFWGIYEIYNHYIFHAWKYILPPAPAWRKYILLGIAWATVLPAILETITLSKELYIRISGRKVYNQTFINQNRYNKLFLYAISAVGFLLLFLPWTGIYPYVIKLPSNVVLILSFLFWGAPALFLDPILYLSGKPSLIGEIEQGNFNKIIILLIAGYFCGFLWEFWNVWAGAKWVYTIPFLQDKIKIFEMPIRGFLDFGPFAVSMYVLYYFFNVTTTERIRAVITNKRCGFLKPLLSE